MLYVDVDGYEGPLDLLLDLARRQKVDLGRISVLALAEQYLSFIETVREKRIEIAADYLVMAAWLAYLKSRLMVPGAPSDDEPSGEMMAALLQFRLKRLEAMREAAMQLVNRPRLGREVHRARRPEPVTIERRNLWEATLYDLLKAYSLGRGKGEPAGLYPVRPLGLVVAGSARDPHPADRRQQRLGAARRLSRPLSRHARGAPHRHRLELCLQPRTGPAG